MQCWQLAVAVQTLLLFSAGGGGGVLANIVNCGACVCDRSSITCDFDLAQDRLKGDAHLRKLIPSPNELASVSLLPSSFEELYVNCKNTKLMRRQRLSRDMLSHFSNLKKFIIVSCDLEFIDADALQALTRLEEFDASDNNLRQLPAECSAGCHCGS